MDENEIYRRRKFFEEKEKREQAAAAQRQAGYIESLDSAKDMREYNERLKALRHRVFQPEAPLDEMAIRDYLKTRNK